MIQIREKHQCCGCGACVQCCPKQCISMIPDEQGFLYPHVDYDSCVNCGFCEKVCPVLNINNKCEPIATYAAINPNEDVRIKSSSGGVFTPIAEYIIDNGGVVFGAKFNENWEVIHDFTESVDGLEAFRGSKYVQSVIGESYKKVEQFLKQGRMVLFTGTPCQNAGLKKYLQKIYNNLYTIDVICHGVPSPLVWKHYIYNKHIVSVNFRNKNNGWKNFSLMLSDGECESHRKNLYMQGFLNNLTLRQSCFCCKTKSGSSGSDLAIADYWGVKGIHPDLDDDKGVSLILVYTKRGQNLLDRLNLFLQKSNYQKALLSNSMIENSVKIPKGYNDFWKNYSVSGLDAIEQAINKMRPSKFVILFRALKFKVKHFLKRTN